MSGHPKGNLRLRQIEMGLHAVILAIVGVIYNYVGLLSRISCHYFLQGNI